jgi:N-acetylglucosaminyldiphosphoundecaprenol N-acetyl-beta-D-mannosaminyltransferase
MNSVTPVISSDAAVARFFVLGIPISVLTMERCVSTMTAWAKEGRPKTVFVRDTSSLVSAAEEPRLHALHQGADLVTPDGMPLVWTGRLRGHALQRVAGPDLLPAVCRESVALGLRHYFYGGCAGVAQEVAANLSRRYPGLEIAGSFSPPMREIGPDFRLTDEICQELAAIRDSGADFVWVGLSSPKQEYFITTAAPHIGRGVFVGIGAAFDFHSGRMRRAPVWMQRSGLECLHRLLCEPRRLWRRYLINAPKFLWLLAREGLGARVA